jgi:hypothetical protein
MIYSTTKCIIKNQVEMRDGFLRYFLTIVLLIIYMSAFSQEKGDTTRSVSVIIDSLKKSGVFFSNNQKKPEIVLSPGQSVKFLQKRVQPQYWNNTANPFRVALEQLIFDASHPPFDSSKIILRNYPYDSLLIPWKNFYIWEPLRLKIPVISQAKFTTPPDSTIKKDTGLVAAVSDSGKVRMLSSVDIKSVTGLKDTTIMVVIDTLDEVTSAVSGFPFKYLSFPYQGDSIQIAVRSLMKYLEERDSTVINFTGKGNEITPVWMNSKTDKMMRYWLKNEFSDSVTIWIGNPSRNTIDLNLEQGVSFRRPVKQGNYADAKTNVKSLDNSKLLNVQKIIVKPQFWKYRTEASFALNQGSVSNWVKGGENSISTALDITGYADYNNKPLKLSSNNFARIKFGLIASGENGIRKNLDLIETNSKLNHKAFGKFDFSGILLFKTQIARGYSYSKTDTVLVSKFMSPAIMTLGFGLDYKPNKTTSLNFSPLSYKATFVIDTLLIDQTKYGIAHDRKSLNEPGISFMISNEYKPFKNITITNRLQLFTNYIHNPQNIDIDWEMILVANLNWFTDVRFNTHLIFDDDTKTVEMKGGNVVLRKDGTKKKTARAQFKEMLGFSFVFRF